MEQQAETGITEPTYHIGGVTYRLEPLSWQQCQWLGEHIFQGVDVQAIDYAAVHDYCRQQAPLLMAICLLAEGQDRKAKSKMSWSAVEALAADFAGELDGMEVAKFGTHFFFKIQPAQLAMLTPGRVIQAALLKAASPPAPGANGSSAASSPSVTEMSDESKDSCPTGDRTTPIPTSDDASSDRPLIMPSSVGAA